MSPSKLDIAELSPTFIRGICYVAHKKGYPVERLFKGLGFHEEDLKQLPGPQMSYRQIRTITKRFQEMVGKDASGLHVGMTHTPLALGLPGLGMLSCRTYGEAAKYVLERQRSVGAIMNYTLLEEGNHFVFELAPRYVDFENESFFVEAEFASVMSLGRMMMGAHFRPEYIEVAYARPENDKDYARIFNCPIKFMAKSHRMALNIKWFNAELHMYDPFMSNAIQEQLDQLIKNDACRSDLVESIVNLLQSKLPEHTNAAGIATELNMSVRTMSRRLAEDGITFQQILDQVRYRKVQKLKNMNSLSMTEIASAVGFADSSNFRRAYKRWMENPPIQTAETLT